MEKKMENEMETGKYRDLRSGALGLVSTGFGVRAYSLGLERWRNLWIKGWGRLDLLAGRHNWFQSVQHQPKPYTIKWI